MAAELMVRTSRLRPRPWETPAVIRQLRNVETRSLPTLTHCFPRNFTFYVAHPIRSIREQAGYLCGCKSSGTIALRFGNLVRRVKFQLTNHARKAVAEREIAVEWIERTLDAPGLIVPNPDDPAIERCFRQIVSRSLPLVSTATSRLYRPCRSPQLLHS